MPVFAIAPAAEPNGARDEARKCDAVPAYSDSPTSPSHEFSASVPITRRHPSRFNRRLAVFPNWSDALAPFYNVSRSCRMRLLPGVLSSEIRQSEPLFTEQACRPAHPARPTPQRNPLKQSASVARRSTPLLTSEVSEKRRSRVVFSPLAPKKGARGAGHSLCESFARHSPLARYGSPQFSRLQGRGCDKSLRPTIMLAAAGRSCCESVGPRASQSGRLLFLCAEPGDISQK